MTDNSAEILFQYYLQEAIMSKSGMDRVSTLWCFPFSFSSADHGIAHHPRCPEGWCWGGCLNHTSFHLLKGARRGSRGPTRKLILLRTQSLVLCYKYKMWRSFLRHLILKGWVPQSTSREHASQPWRGMEVITDLYNLNLLLSWWYCSARSYLIWPLLPLLEQSWCGFAEQMPSLHRVAPRYLKQVTSSNFWPFLLISALMLFVVLVMILLFSVLTSIPYALALSTSLSVLSWSSALLPPITLILSANRGLHMGLPQWRGMCSRHGVCPAWSSLGTNWTGCVRANIPEDIYCCLEELPQLIVQEDCNAGVLM